MSERNTPPPADKAAAKVRGRGRPFRRGADERRNYAGRPKGSSRAAAISRWLDAIGEHSMSPLEYALRVMNDPQATSDDRLMAAALAMPFCHSRTGERFKGLTVPELQLDYAAAAQLDDEPTLYVPPVRVVTHWPDNGGNGHEPAKPK